MASSVGGIAWVTPPSKLAKAIEKYGQDVLVAVYQMALYFGQKMQDEARRGAKWEDRTGNARGGLFFAVDGLGLMTVQGGASAALDEKSARDVAIVSGTRDTLVLCISHTMYYGRFLELSNGGRYAIIMSTLERNLPQMQRQLRALLAG